MKINYFITHFPYKNHVNEPKYFACYRCGGAELTAYYLASEVAKRGHEVNVFTTSIDSRNSFEKYDHMNVYRYGTKLKIENANISFGLFTKPLSHDGDIVHAHFSTPPAEIAALWYAKKRKIPIVLTYHGDWQENFGRITRRMALHLYNRYLLDVILSSVDIIISPSQYYIYDSRFLSKYQDKIIVIPNGINIESFEVPYPKEECRRKLGLGINKNIILFVGNLIRYKGPDILVRALSIVVKEIPNTELIFVGSGNMRNELEELSKKLGTEKYVKFAGFVEEYLKPLYYKAADVFCLPSIMSTEVFPLVLLEAAASGLPIVVSDLNTFKCIIKDGYNGLFTKRGDAKSLASAIIYLLENEDVRRRMGENARKNVENYSWNKITEEYEEVYERVLNENLSSRRI
ncbi:MAG: glycosyltransferase family 4 protein [archaeon YNP-WB-062]|jgi:glycosyltransferase involved in cell wall biosynthesis|nr:glycosyltransferase family 4 protein [Candidatus Culexarchaeum yellowstonense]